MRRRQRVLVVVAILAGVIAGSAVLTATSLESKGPLSSILARSASAFGALENAVRRRIIGSGWADRLAWFKPNRDKVEFLRSPDRVLIGAYDGGIPQTLDGIVDLEQSVETVFPLIH